MACRKQWFAVKNLLRRQVVPFHEFKELYGSKTAAEWAEHYGESLIAKELRFYVSGLDIMNSRRNIRGNSSVNDTVCHFDT